MFQVTFARMGLVSVALSGVLLVSGCAPMAQHGGGDVDSLTKTALNSSKEAVASLKEVPGTYAGLIPCADCTGIKSTYRLHEDGTFSKTEVYLGAKSEKFDDKGKWHYKNGIVILTDEKDPHPYMLRAEKGQLRFLDADGKSITGELENDYILKKIR